MNRIDAGRPDIGKLRQYGFSGDNGVLRYSETLGCGFTLTFVCEHCVLGMDVGKL